jgi:hypothetical protein
MPKTSTDVACQTTEDQSDALRINPFVGQRIEKKVNTIINKAVPKATGEPPNQRAIKKTSKPLVEECYPTDNGHRGICLVLEHDTFSPNLQLRCTL